MLLSSVAETMYWTGRHLQRAQCLAQTVQGYERVSLDLPGAQSLDLRPLLALVSSELLADGSSFEDSSTALRALVLNASNPSSVMGALALARDNLRQGRVATPPEVWATLNDLYMRLLQADGEQTCNVLAMLDQVVDCGSRIQGELIGGMTRDAGYAFLRIGSQLEQAEMLLRTLEALLPVFGLTDAERVFDDVRWMGLLRVVAAHAMYRRRYHSRFDLRSVLSFLISEKNFPKSVLHALHAIEEELRRLPRPMTARAALTACRRDAAALASSSASRLIENISGALSSLQALHEALKAAYFPEQVAAESRTPLAGEAADTTSTLDPFEHLRREHVQIDAALQVLDELVARAHLGHDPERRDLATLLAFLSDFGDLLHHEKEEGILSPALVANGFDWYEGAVAAMRRQHRQEHYFMRVLTHLASQNCGWSSDNRRQFVDIGRELAQFLRSHMDHEQLDLFEIAARTLPQEVKSSMTAAFLRFDAEQAANVEAARAGLNRLLKKYCDPAIRAQTGGSAD